MVGDGSYLMKAQEIVTSIPEGLKLTVLQVDNKGVASIGALSRSKGTAGFGIRYRHRKDGSVGDDTDAHDGDALSADLAINVEGVGAQLIGRVPLTSSAAHWSPRKRSNEPWSSACPPTATKVCQITAASGTSRWPRCWKAPR